MKIKKQYKQLWKRLHKPILIWFAAILLITLSGKGLFGQDQKDSISVSELISLMQADQEVIEISNVRIIFTDVDKKHARNKIFYWIVNIEPKHSRAQKIYFYDCDFKTGKKAPIIFEHWQFEKLNIVGCTINNDISFRNCAQTGDYPILLENDTIHGNIIFDGNEPLKNIEINRCLFYNTLFIKSNLNSLIVNHSQFDTDTSSFTTGIRGKTEYQFSFHNQNIYEVNLKNCSFTNNNLTNVFSVDLGGTEIDKLILLNNKMNVLSFGDTKIETAILIDSLVVTDYINVRNFDFPESNTNVPWYNLGSERLAIFEKEVSGQIIPYQAKTKSQLLNTLYYNDLISAYNKFNTLYHDRGDLNSANQSYVEIKSLETRRQKQLLSENWNFNVYINYKLNVFLSSFSDFATNPGKSLIKSLWILLAFTVLFMISFSEWDGMNYGYYLSQYRLFSTYVKTDSNVNELYSRSDNPHKDLMKQIRVRYLDKGKEIPRALRFFGKPLHFLGKFRFEIMPGLIRVFNFQGKSWKSLNSAEKTYSGFLIILILISFMVYVFLVKFINAFILSLNSFVVIGFGMLPEKGLAMYLSIIEGIIGWFLLTIFTITLLSQVLQNA